MKENDNINLSVFDLKNKKENQIKPKRIEWLNFFSKGFIVQSINNEYKNKNFKIKKHNNNSQIKRNIIPRNLTTIILNQEFKSNINNSNLSSKKTNFSLLINDEEDKNKLFISNKSNIKEILTERNNKNINNKKEIINMCKSYTDRKDNSVKNKKYNKTENQIKEKKINNYTSRYTQQRIKMNTKIILKKDIHSPLLNYLDSINKNKNKNLFNLTNNNYNNKALNKNNYNINSNSKINLNLTNIENNNTENKKHKYKYSKSIKEIKINNINIIEIQKHMVEGRKFKNHKKSHGYNNDYKGEMREYSFDDEEEEKVTLTDRKKIISFSEICNPANNYMTNNKKDLNEFFDEITKKKKTKTKIN